MNKTPIIQDNTLFDNLNQEYPILETFFEWVYSYSAIADVEYSYVSFINMKIIIGFVRVYLLVQVLFFMHLHFGFLTPHGSCVEFDFTNLNNSGSSVLFGNFAR